MSVKFFGQFLIERGEVDNTQLRSALTLMRNENRSVGEIAVEMGLLSEAAAARINVQQRSKDRQFGELAVDLGLLTIDQIDQVLQHQIETRLQIGEALVRLGHLTSDRLEEMLAAFKADQAPHEAGALVLPEPLTDHALAPKVVDLFPRSCLRLARLHTKLGTGRPLGSPPDLEVCVALAASGELSLEVHLLADRAWARRVASGTSGLPLDEIDDDLLEDGVGEFLNVLLGNAIVALGRDGVRVDLETPRFGVRPTRGVAFDVVSTEGTALLVLV